MEKINFSLSPSSINTYKGSQLCFYYVYVAKDKPDTKVPQCYGAAGNVVHDILEDYFYNPNMNIMQDFEKRWAKKNLNIERGMNGKPLSKSVYFKAINNGINIINNKYKVLASEESIEYPLYEDDTFYIRIKGIIDNVVEKDGELMISDWKTSSAVDKGEGFFLQGKHYCLMYWLKHKKMITKATFEYIKIGKEKSYEFTKEEILEHYEYVKKLALEIAKKGTNINNYDIGDVSSIFNGHIKKCKREMLKRQGNTIECAIKNNTLHIASKLPQDLINALDDKYSYDINGAQWSPLFKSKRWDGKKHLFSVKKQTLPLGLIHNFLALLKDYNDYFNKDIKLKINDIRNKEIMNRKFEYPYKKSQLLLYSYQKEAIEAALKNEIGIIYIGTGGGKTEIAKEIIRRVDGRSLFVVNRIELANQTAEEFQKDLCDNVGLLTEGQLNIYSKITIASIQTLAVILKRKNEESKKLRLFLSNINLCIWDECQNLKNAGMYSLATKSLINCKYLIGLTGTPFRADEHTLMMNALVGFPVYSKPTKELADEGFICRSKCYFINNKRLKIDVYENYHEKYSELIVYNEHRNFLIKDIVEQNPDKKILVITRIVEHARIVGDLCKGYVITGSTNKDLRKDYFKEFKTSGKNVLVGSVKIFSAGINIPKLDMIINACSNKSDVDTLQTIGRVLRKSMNKKFGVYYDFIDEGTHFESFSKERMKALEKFDHDIKVVDEDKLIETFKY